MFPEGEQIRKHCFPAMFPEGEQIRKHCFLAMFPEGEQTRKHCFLAMFPEGEQIRKHCFPAMFPEGRQPRLKKQRFRNQNHLVSVVIIQGVERLMKNTKKIDHQGPIIALY
jgi:hypothetical protein